LRRIPWREHLRLQGYRSDSPDDLNRIWRERWVTSDELDAPLPEQSWWSTWEHDESPQAKAYTLLKGLGLDCGLNRPGGKAGRINFVEGATTQAAPSALSSCEMIFLSLSSRLG
jgi:hypothetical protein